MLSRLLSIAAAATAASIVGNQRADPSDTQQTEAQNEEENGNDDRSFDGFLRSLQNGGLATELRNDAANQEGNQTTPLNFFRMFRLGSSESTTGSDQRMVTVIIVGIRSVPSGQHGQGNGTGSQNLGAIGNTFDPILDNLPFAVPSSALRSQRRRSDESMETVGSRSSPWARGRRRVDALFPDSDVENIDEDNDEDEDNDSESGIIESEDEDDSDAMNIDIAADFDMDHHHHYHHHHHHHSHRQSHEQDRLPSTENETAGENSEGSSRQARSWIIYVLGGSYPEDHPILTTPSLFTDSPTYEDLITLSNIIGPAKTPVASQSDVNSAGGLFPATSDMVEERCLVCLQDFEQEENCRKLNECGHVFHQSCIDEWLMTGRNTCPLCRGIGVKENSSTTPNFTEATS
ncbi:hypothetical protein V1514DRAFT_328273 [Lipomyces japonicus]|uniref:uncharacterized protein n=1 Tax=Lipomyces japonicus TaxID=56871 RepID=UPI0034CF15D8